MAKQVRTAAVRKAATKQARKAAGKKAAARRWRSFFLAILYFAMPEPLAVSLSWVLYPTASVPSRPSPVVASIGSTLAVSSVQLTVGKPLGGPNEYQVTVTGSSPEHETARRNRRRLRGHPRRPSRPRHDQPTAVLP